MRKRFLPSGDDGFTLIELLIASAMMVIIVSALVAALVLSLRTSIGLSPTAAANGQDSTLLSTQIDAHIGIQSLARYFTADINNANRPANVVVTTDSPAPDVQCARPTPTPASVPR